MSLADVYDVEGSIAGIDDLLSREIFLTHEMGATIFSERLSARINRGTTGAIAQNIDWNIEFTNLAFGGSVGRVVGLTIFTDVVARLAIANLNLVDPIDGREIPLFVWDSNEASVIIRLSDEGAAAANVDMLIPINAGAIPPVIILGADQPGRMDSIFFRGSTNGFGAGTVTITALIHVLDPRLAGLSSRGIPVPSW